MTRAALPLAIGALVVIVTSACHRMLGPEKPESFVGLVLPLIEGPELVVAGKVERSDARVVLETAQAYSSVTTGCWPRGEAPASPGTVKVPTFSGKWRELPEVPLRAARIGTTRLGSRTVALTRGEICTLTLGLDVLAPYAFEIDPLRRLVEISLSGSAVTEGALSFTRDPTRDWWLVTARVRQQAAQLTGPFVFSSGSRTSRLSTKVGIGNGMIAGVRGLEVEGAPIPEPLKRAPFRTDAVELAPEWIAEGVALAASEGWEDPAALGLLGADVWGRFRARIDVGLGTLMLQRPKDRGDVRLDLREDDRRMSAVLWHDVGEKGAQLIFTADVASPCRWGASFPAGHSGGTVSSTAPWPALVKAMPECAEAIASASSVTIENVLPERHRSCPGSCLFAQDLEHGVTTCACEPTPFLSEEEEAQWVAAYRGQLPTDGGVPFIRGWADPLPEPEDPP